MSVAKFIVNKISAAAYACNADKAGTKVAKSNVTSKQVKKDNSDDSI